MAGSGPKFVAGVVIAVAAVAVVLATHGCDDDAGPPSEEPAPSAPKRETKTPRPRATTPSPDAGSAAAQAPPKPGKTGISMNVRVRDPDGAPVAWVRVVCCGPAVGATAASAVSGADGVARVADVSEGPLVVQWEPPSPGWSRGFRLVPRAQSVDVVLERMSRLAGTVLNADGTPARGIALEFERAAAEPLAALLQNALTQTNASGAFEVVVPRGRWLIRVRRGFSADDAAASRFGPFDAGQTDLRLVIPDWPRIEARVAVPEGAPNVGWMWFERDGGELPTPYVSPGDGGFRSPLLREGAVYDVVARGDFAGNGSSWAIARGVAAGTTGLVLEAKQARAIRGRIVDAKGNAVTEAVTVRVSLRPDAPPGPFDITLAPAQGEFTIPMAPWFAVRLVAGGDGTPWWTPDPPLAEEGDHRVVTVVVEPTAFVRGRLQLDESTPVPGGSIGTPTRWAQVKADGTFTYGGCIPGRAVSLAWIPSAGAQTTPVPLGEVKAPGADVVLTLKLP